VTTPQVDYFAHASTPEEAVLRRIKGEFRRSFIAEAIRTDGKPQDKVRSLHRFVVEEQALDVPEQADPLDPIDISEIRLVCWMAVRPER
jgi:hypothetical protein